ncbi:DUF3046 domain-containing protein [Nocardioides dubius]|uniref:DUF3046 domain-containing protein n=1 Tax=Nocardioides dubius TaxID=317019 RepID=A0ABN1U3Q1_9ACTN
MRHTEFWSRMDAALGHGYARTWAEQHTLTELGSRTALEALDAGTAPKVVWEAVWENLGLPLRDK